MSGSAEVLNKKKVKVLEKNYCPKQDSNAGPCDLQSSALPSELQICWQKVVQLYFTYLHVRRPVRTEIMIWSWQFAILFLNYFDIDRKTKFSALSPALNQTKIFYNLSFANFATNSKFLCLSETVVIDANVL